MAIDNTPPRLKLIVTIAVIVIVTLIGLDFVFKSYYAFMVGQAEAEKLAPPKARDEQLAAERAALVKADIGKAMQEVANGTRPAAIAPEQSTDLSPMTGWSKMPKPAPTAETIPPLGMLQSIDGGAALAAANADAGVTAPGAAGAVLGNPTGNLFEDAGATLGGPPLGSAGAGADAGAPRAPAATKDAGAAAPKKAATDAGGAKAPAPAPAPNP